MKGLLWKDFIVIRTNYQKNFLLILVAYTAVSVLSDTEYLFYIFSVMLGIYVLASLSCDENSRWDTLARALPVTPAQIVGAKYLLGLGAILLGTLIGVVLSLAVGLARADTSLENAIAGCCTSTMVALVYFAVGLPLSYKMGAIKGRTVVTVALLLLMVGLGGLVWAIGQFAFARRLFDALTAGLNDAGIAAFCAGMMLIGLLAYGISWAVSAAIYTKKEF